MLNRLAVGGWQIQTQTQIQIQTQMTRNTVYHLNARALSGCQTQIQIGFSTAYRQLIPVSHFLRLFQTQIQMTRNTVYHLNARALSGCQIQMQIGFSTAYRLPPTAN